MISFEAWGLHWGMFQDSHEFAPSALNEAARKWLANPAGIEAYWPSYDAKYLHG